jgi:hypothetical protein
MPFEDLSFDATQAEASAWAMRMTAQGYRAANRMERSMRVVRDCRGIKDPLKIADRFLLAHGDLVFAAADAEGHPDPRYRNATRGALASFTPQVQDQFPRCIAAFSDARRAMLAKAKGGKRQLTIAEKSLSVIRDYENSATWANKPAGCQAAVDAAIGYWTDQVAVLAKYGEAD